MFGGCNLKKILRNYAFLFTIAGFIVILDQLTKSIVRNNIVIGEIWSPWPWLTPYARIIHWYNTGVAFGFFQGSNQIFTVVALIVALVVIYYFPQIPRAEWALRLALSMQLGGAIGNLIDRLTIGHVTDFISIGNFAVFNVADASITMGVVVLMVGIWLQDRREKKDKDAAPEIQALDTPPIDSDHIP